jgi:hypothetical protein
VTTTGKSAATPAFPVVIAENINFVAARAVVVRAGTKKTTKR